MFGTEFSLPLTAFWISRIGVGVDDTCAAKFTPETAAPLTVTTCSDGVKAFTRFARDDSLRAVGDAVQDVVAVGIGGRNRRLPTRWWTRFRSPRG